MMQKNEKTEIIVNNRTHETDTGSPEVQVAILTKRINDLNLHLKENPKDINPQGSLFTYIILIPNEESEAFILNSEFRIPNSEFAITLRVIAFPPAPPEPEP